MVYQWMANNKIILQSPNDTFPIRVRVFKSSQKIVIKTLLKHFKLISNKMFNKIVFSLNFREF